jgi:hypothetical protein
MVGTRSSSRIAALLSLLLLASLAPLSSQEPPDSGRITVTGRVVDRTSGLPLENAVVRIPQLEVNLLSDSAGLFRLEDVQPGVFRMNLSCLGYHGDSGDFTVVRPGSFSIGLWPKDAGPDADPGRIMGRVTALENGEPIRDAEVTIADRNIRRTTNRHGWFELPEVPAGLHVIKTSFLDRTTRRDSVFVGDNEALELDVKLAVDPIPLEGITVTARPRWLVASGFMRRRGRNYEGRQWTREELESLDPVFVGDVLTTVPGIRSMGMEGYYGRRQCRLTIFVDDVEMDEYFHLDMLEPRNIEALEVYHGTGKPGEFFWYCGVVLVWLKH